MSDDSGPVELSPQALTDLMRKCQSLGWEVHAGFHTEKSAREQRRRLFREFTSREMP